MSHSVAPADKVREVINSVVAPAAREVDARGQFPEASIRALGEAGTLGILSAADVGGAGGSLRQAAETIEALAGACGSTAMVVLMHYAAVPVIEANGPRATREAVGTTGLKPVPLSSPHETPAGVAFSKCAARSDDVLLSVAEALARSVESRSCDR